jgi:two-component system LytT family sensor kinase
MFWSFTQTGVMHRMGLSWHISIIDAVISNALLGLFCFVSIAIFYYYQPGGKNRSYRFIFALGLCILYVIILRFTLNYTITTDIDYPEFLHKSMPVRFIMSLLVLSFVTMLNWMYSLLKDQKEQEKRRSDAEQLVKDAELARLRQQLQPHFLFNSLNSISALAGTKPNEARKMIQQLSDFLRGTLKKDDQQCVELKEELEHLKLYLEIEKVRFGHRLDVEINFEEATLGMLIPPLLLQPIVENAIKFGLYDTVDEILISISSYVGEGLLHVKVENPFDAETQAASQGTGFGLSSIQRRLYLLYSRNDLMVTEKKENRFITILKIPQIK